MRKLGSTCLGLGFIVLAAASCGRPGPSGAGPGDGGAGGGGDTDGGPIACWVGIECGLDAGGAADGATNDARPANLSLELIAGDIVGAGTEDGTSGLRFSPFGVAADSAGNVYVIDTSNTILKVTPAGVVTTLAGTASTWGGADGTGAAARFSRPRGPAVDGADNVYVADRDNHTIRKITPDGVVTTLAGTAGVPGSTDGTGAAARFYFPEGVAVDRDGNLYVGDSGNFTIRKITPDGAVTTLAGAAGAPGNADGAGTTARFEEPRGMAVDGDGNVYVADTVGRTIRKITPAGVVTTLAGTADARGSADGTGAAARLDFPTSVAVDRDGNLYVTEAFDSTIRKITPAGVVTTLAGTAGVPGPVDGTGAAARFGIPEGVAVDGAGNVYVADLGNGTVRKVTSVGVVTTLTGTASLAGFVDGTGAAARFAFPAGAAVDSAGNVHVADTANGTVRTITPDGVVTTLAGTAGVSGSADGTGAAARFDQPSGVALDATGNVYVADAVNATLRKVTPDGVVTTLAGTAGLSGGADGTGAAARFNWPRGVAVDGAGNLYVADFGNQTVRKVTPDGVVTTLAGTAGMAGDADGTGAAARFNGPAGVAVDRAGNLYVADSLNHTIRKVTAAGVVTTLESGAALFYDPAGVAVDGAGNVFVADRGNSTIYKIAPSGTTIKVAGMARLDSVFRIVLGTTPRFALPEGLAIAGDSLVISDLNAILLLRRGAQ